MQDSEKSPADSKTIKSDILFYALIAAGVLLVIMLLSASLLTPQLQPSQLRYEEEPLQKQPLPLKGGEYYRYSYYSNFSEQPVNFTITYVIGKVGNCTAIYIPESQNKTPTCINEHGNDAWGANASLGNSFMYFFKPWMLAVRDNWQWDVAAYFPLPTGVLEISEISYRTAGKEIIDGREAYKVVAELAAEDAEPQQITYWIDEKKRVLLKEEGPGYSIILTASSLTN